MNRPLPIIAAFMIALAAPSAWAVPPPPDVPPPGFAGGWSGIYSPEVLTLFELAYKAERRGDERGALDLFEQALQLHKSNDAEAELGLALLRAGKHVRAARHLSMALSYGPRLRARRYEDVLAGLKECKKHVGTIVLYPNVPHTRVFVGEEEVHELWTNQEFYVEPGKHHIKATKEGYWMNQTTVDVAVGKTAEVILALQQRINTQIMGFERPLNVNMRGYSKEAREDKPTWPTNLMIASGVGMGLGTAAVGMGLVLRDGGEGKSSDTWTGIAAGGVALLGLSVTGLIIGIASRPEPDAPSVYIAPSVSNEGVGVAAGGKW